MRVADQALRRTRRASADHRRAPWSGAWGRGRRSRDGSTGSSPPREPGSSASTQRRARPAASWTRSIFARSAVTAGRASSASIERSSSSSAATSGRPASTHLGGPGIALGVLLEVARRDATPPDDLALVHVLGATDDPSIVACGTVRADDPDPGAVGHHEVDPLSTASTYDLCTPTRLTTDISTTEGTEPLGRRLERLQRAEESVDGESGLRSHRAPADPLGAAGRVPAPRGSLVAGEPFIVQFRSPPGRHRLLRAASRFSSSRMPPRAACLPTASTGRCRSSPTSPPRRARPRLGDRRRPRPGPARAARRNT